MITDAEFEALIRLLDDEDEETIYLIEQQLKQMGEGIVPKLESAWEKNESTIIQDRIADLLQMVQVHHSLNALRNWRLGGSKDVLKGWFIISQLQYPSLVWEDFQKKVSRLVNMIWIDMHTQSDDAQRLFAINRLLFDKEGFTANASDPLSPDSFYINRLFQSKKGNPHSLGLLYLVIARQLDLPISAIVLPNYFALHYENHRKNFYIDAFNKGAFFTKEDIRTFLSESQEDDQEEYYKPVSNRHIIYNMLYQLRASYQSRNQTEKVRIMDDMIKLVTY